MSCLNLSINVQANFGRFGILPDRITGNTKLEEVVLIGTAAPTVFNKLLRDTRAFIGLFLLGTENLFIRRMAGRGAMVPNPPEGLQLISDSGTVIDTGAAFI